MTFKHHFLSIFYINFLLLIAACSTKKINVDNSTTNTVKKESSEMSPSELAKKPLELDFAISLYASSLDNLQVMNNKICQQVDKATVVQVARDYIDAWNTREKEEIKKKMMPIFSSTGIYADPIASVIGIEQLSETITGMHGKIKAKLNTTREFKILGVPELVFGANNLFYNADNLLTFNWDWRQDGENVLYGKEFTLFTDEQTIRYDMGIFGQETSHAYMEFPEHQRKIIDGMKATANAYLNKLNQLENEQKYQIIEAALTHPASIQNGSHDEKLAILKTADLTNAQFEITGSPSFTLISMAYPWELTLDGKTLLKGLELNVFDKEGKIKHAFGISGK